MLIGEVAAATGTTTKTLRFYEREGLLPEPARTESGYRDYPSAAVTRIAFVKHAQGAGFTLRQIREVLDVRDRGEAPCDHVATLIDERLDEVEERLRELRRVRRELQTMRARAQRTDPADCHGTCIIIESD